MNDLTLSSSQLQLLGKFDTPTVCNVIELFNVRPRNTGYMDQRIQACFPDMPPMVGYASTATFRSSGIQATNSYSTTEHQVMAFDQIPSPPIVVFQDLDNPTAPATFGEVMCITYQRFGASGIITSGAGRDLDQVQILGFPGSYRRNHLFPRVLPYSINHGARTCGRNDGLSGRSTTWRPKWNDQDSR